MVHQTDQSMQRTQRGFIYHVVYYERKCFTVSRYFCRGQSVGITVREEAAKNEFLTVVVAIFPLCCNCCNHVVAFAFVSISLHLCFGFFTYPPMYLTDSKRDEWKTRPNGSLGADYS